jgi:tetratricopeptide (TPR) repeat protein
MERKLLGEDNPASLDTLRSLGLTFQAQGKLADAEKMHREALALWRKRGEAEIPQAMSELRSLTLVLMAEKKFGDAEQLLDESLTPSVAGQSSYTGFIALRADLKARLGQWREAADDAAFAFEREPLNQERYCVLAALLIKNHDFHGYEQLCHRILTTYPEPTNPFVADQVAKACLFSPLSGVDMVAVGRLADTAVSRGAGYEGAMPFFQLCKALSEYRLGHFAEAVAWAEKPITSPSVYSHGQAYAVLAMAHWRIGEKQKAREMLEQGNALAPAIMPMRDASDPGNAWQAWLFARISLNEATAFIAPESTSDSNSGVP